MMGKRVISIIAALSLALASVCVVFAEGENVTTLSELKTAFAAAGTYTLGNDIDVTNSGTTLSKVRLQSTTAKLNIGASWSGSFEITMDSPSNRTLGTVGAELHFDMNQRSALYHGSTGFLYGTSEINVPSIDLLQGLKPKVMVQKALGGLQHPTGDAIRALSSNLAGGAQQIQVYLQDIYLEWPYNAPFDSSGNLDVDGYIKTVQEILYGMICDKAAQGEAGAFLGNDGN